MLAYVSLSVCASCARREWLWVNEICNCMHARVCLCDEYCEILGIILFSIGPPFLLGILLFFLKKIFFLSSFFISILLSLYPAVYLSNIFAMLLFAFVSLILSSVSIHLSVLLAFYLNHSPYPYSITIMDTIPY